MVKLCSFRQIGFTLLETLVYMALLSLLISALVLSHLNFQKETLASHTSMNELEAKMNVCALMISLAHESREITLSNNGQKAHFNIAGKNLTLTIVGNSVSEANEKAVEVVRLQLPDSLPIGSFTLAERLLSLKLKNVPEENTSPICAVYF